jgi:hypothetical protein
LDLDWAADHISEAMSQSQTNSSSSSREHRVLQETEPVRTSLRNCLLKLQQDCQHWQVMRAWQQAVAYADKHKYAHLRPPYNPFTCAAAAAAVAAAAGGGGTASDPAASQQQQDKLPTGDQVAAASNGNAGLQQNGSPASTPAVFKPYTLEQAAADVKKAEEQAYLRLSYATALLWMLLSAIPDPSRQRVYLDLAVGKLPAGETSTCCTQDSKAKQRPLIAGLQHLLPFLHLHARSCLCTLAMVLSCRDAFFACGCS